MYKPVPTMRHMWPTMNGSQPKLLLIKGDHLPLLDMLIFPRPTLFSRTSHPPILLPMLSAMAGDRLGITNMIAPSLVATGYPPLVLPLLLLVPTHPTGRPLLLVRGSPSPRVLMGAPFSGVASARGGLPLTTLPPI